VIFIKLHPHVRNAQIDKLGFINLSQNVMLELYLVNLISQENRITIYHDNSFSVLNFSDKIKAINIGQKKDDFDLIEQWY